MCTDKKIDIILDRQDIWIEKIEMLLKNINTQQIIEWIPVSSIAEDKGLTSDAIRKQLKNGDFEEGVDFKYKGSKIEVHQGAIGRIQRKRRSSNG